MRTYAGPRVDIPLRRRTIVHSLRQHARERPDAVYLDVPEEGSSLTFAELLRQAEALAGGLLSSGLHPGERVLVMQHNTTTAVLVSTAILLAGLVEVPINTAYHGAILAHQVRSVAPAAAIVDPGLAPQLVHAAHGLRTVYLTDTDGPADEAVGDVRRAGGTVQTLASVADGPVMPLPDPRPEDLAVVMFTSGTTGPSKGVMMPHGQLWFFAAEGASMTRLRADDRYLATTPLYHANAKVLVGMGALLAGATFVLRRRFSASRWASWLREDRVTVTNLVGAMMDFVWQQPPSSDDAANDLRCLRAGPTAPYATDFRARFGVESIVEAFGSTECSSPILTPYGSDATRPTGAVGLAVADWFDVRLADPGTGADVAIGEVGELLVRPRAPWTMTTGYDGLPTETLAAFRDLWFHTGDAMRRDDDGWFFFVDRLSDTVRRRGENISSFEVEQPLLEHPGIAECAVVAVPADAVGGEDEVMAILVPAPGAVLDLDEVWDWCDSRLPRFCVPRYLRVLDELPRTPSEKVMKSDLRAAGITPDTVDRLERDQAQPGGDGGAPVSLREGRSARRRPRASGRRPGP